MEQLDDRVVGVCEVRRDEKARPAGEKVCCHGGRTRNFVFRPSVPGTSDVLRSSVRRSAFTLAGISGRAAAVPMDSSGPAIFMASMKSAEVAAAMAWKSAVKSFLPMAALVPLRRRMRRTTSPKTAMSSGVLKRLWQEAL